MDRLISTLPRILKAAGDSEEVVEAACIAAWKFAAGAGLTDHARPLRLNEKTLVIAVADATWQRQLRSLSTQLLARLNLILGQQRVAVLDFRVDPEALAQTNEPQDDTDRFESQVIPVELLTAAAQIHDRELRRAFLGAAMSCIKRVEQCP